MSLPAALAATGADDVALTAAATDALAFLRGGGMVRDAAAQLLVHVRGDEAVTADPATATLPFRTPVVVAIAQGAGLQARVSHACSRGRWQKPCPSRRTQ